jgi:Phage integrase family
MISHRRADAPLEASMSTSAHSAAMELLQAGVDCSVIALWLGHESIETTQTYLHAHLALKEVALANTLTNEPALRSSRKPPVAFQTHPLRATALERDKCLTY